MSNLGYHLRTHLEDDRVIATTARERRILARVVLEQARRDDLYLFDCPDQHLHIAARCGRIAAGRLSHRIGSSLTQRLGLPVGFVQYPPKPIEDNRHLYHTARYILRQRQHHGLALDPRAESSSVADLLGLRVLGRYTVQNIHRWLPRLQRKEVLDLSGLSEPKPINNYTNGADLCEAMRAAGCINDLTGASRELIALRTAAVAAVGKDVSARTLATQLGINKRTVQRLRARLPDPDLVHAIRLQLSLGDSGVLSMQR